MNKDELIDALVKMVSDLIQQRSMMPKGKLVYMGDKVSAAIKAVIDERIEQLVPLQNRKADRSTRSPYDLSNRPKGAQPWT